MAKVVKIEDQTKCCMCGTPKERLQGKVISGMYGLICKTCVKKCDDIHKSIDSKDKPAAKAVEPGKAKKVPSPKEIKAFLDEYVVGQERAKRVLSVAVSSHYSRVFRQNEIPENHPLFDVEVSKSNVLMVGNTGTGKTLLAQTLARMMDVPFSISDCTTMTEAGFVGEDVENALLRLYRNADCDLARTQVGIIFLDELDKSAKKGIGGNLTKDPSGEGVQQALLKLIEGTMSSVPLQGGRKHPQAETINIDTTNIMFVCGGAFVGLDEIVRQRITGKGILGFGMDESNKKTVVSRVEPEDLIAYGLIPELVGRLAVTCQLSQLSKADLLRILVEPKNCLVKQFEKLALIGGAKLKFNDDALEEIVKVAMARTTGARGLRSVVEDVVNPMFFDMEKGQDIVITANDVVKAFGGDGMAA